MMNQNSFDVVRLGDIKEVPEKQWHIDQLWGHESVGIIGGEPKTCKSWLALEMALATASKTPCLGVFDIKKPGLCLAYFAEDSRQNTLLRFQNLCKARGIEPDTVPLLLIDSPVLRLDEEKDRQKLEITLEKYRPTLLVLDPLVRLHSLDENSAREMAGLLSFIRGLQRKYKVAIVLTHHTSKKRHARPGQSLRGSGDLHAFGDTNIYLSKVKGAIRVQLEHRDAPSDDQPIFIKLIGSNDNKSVHLKLVDTACGESVPLSDHDSVEDRILAFFSKTSGFVTGDAIRKEIGIRNAKVYQYLKNLEQNGRITKAAKGWLLA